MPGPIVKVLVLTEDSAGDSHDTLCEVVKRMFRLVVQGCKTHCIRFDQASEPLRAIMRGNLWKSTKPKEQWAVTDLVRSIATQVARRDGFVIFHFDGDRPWQEHEYSENAAKFEDIVRKRVLAVLKAPGGGHRTDEEANGLLLGLIALVPFYCIESWLYQNTEAAIAISKAQYQGRDVERLEAWAEDRSALDEEKQPRDGICLGSRHNLALAMGRFPASEVFCAGKSYCASVWHLLRHEALISALSATALEPAGRASTMGTDEPGDPG